MLFVLPTASATRPASYLTPQPYEYPISQGYYHYPDAPRFAAPSYLTPQLHFLREPSPEELEEREYQRALDVAANHRRRQAEAVIHRQQQFEVVRQWYLSSLAAELEHQRQEEILVARRAEFARSQRA